MSTCIGIDFGNTHSCIGVYKSGSIEIIANEQGNRFTPSTIAFNDKDILIGETAAQQAGDNPANTIHHVKQLLGIDTSSKDFSSLSSSLSFSLSSSSPLTVSVEYKGKKQEYTIEEIATQLLSKLKQTADSYTGLDCSSCVIAVPTNWSPERQALLEKAAAAAGLKVLRVIKETTAIALAYDLDQSSIKDENVLIFDLGGSSSCASIVHSHAGILQIKSSSHSNSLSGKALDERLMKYFGDEFKKSSGGIELSSGGQRAIQRVRANVERVKTVLSSSTSAGMELDALVDGADLYTEITRARFEGLIAPDLRHIRELALKAVTEAGLQLDDVDRVVLAGGSTFIPKIYETLKNIFAKEPQRSANPNESVAYGCAIQASLLHEHRDSENLKKELTLSSTSLSLGVEAADGVFYPVLPRLSPIPITHSILASPSSSPQLLSIYEGEAILASRNKLLAKLQICASSTPITISFTVQENGDLVVKAEDTGKKVLGEVKVEGGKTGRREREEVEKVVKESKEEKAKEEKSSLMSLHNKLNELLGSGKSIKNRIDSKGHKEVDEVMKWLENVKLSEKGVSAEVEKKVKELESIEEKNQVVVGSSSSDDVDDYVAAAGGEGEVGIDDLD